MVGISYKDDIENEISIITKEILITMPFVLRIPEPEFRVEELGDSSVNIQILVWHPKDVGVRHNLSCLLPSKMF